jgi:hypothetical protein
MDTSLPRGAVVLCNFPYDDNPNVPGPTAHFCIVVESFEHKGQQFAAVCYGTSADDQALFAQHHGNVMTVSSSLIKGIEMSKGRTNFLADHVAIVPLNDKWFVPTVRGRLDIFRPEKRENDVQRARLFQQFEKLEKVMLRGAMIAAAHLLQTGKVGLPPGKTLR